MHAWWQRQRERARRVGFRKHRLTSTCTTTRASGWLERASTTRPSIVAVCRRRRWPTRRSATQEPSRTLHRPHLVIPPSQSCAPAISTRCAIAAVANAAVLHGRGGTGVAAIGQHIVVLTRDCQKNVTARYGVTMTEQRNSANRRDEQRDKRSNQGQTPGTNPGTNGGGSSESSSTKTCGCTCASAQSPSKCTAKARCLGRAGPCCLASRVRGRAPSRRWRGSASSHVSAFSHWSMR